MLKTAFEHIQTYTNYSGAALKVGGGGGWEGLTSDRLKVGAENAFFSVIFYNFQTSEEGLKPPSS